VIAARAIEGKIQNPHRPGEQNCHPSATAALVCPRDEVEAAYINQVAFLQRRRILEKYQNAKRCEYRPILGLASIPSFMVPAKVELVSRALVRSGGGARGACMALPILALKKRARHTGN